MFVGSYQPKLVQQFTQVWWVGEQMDCYYCHLSASETEFASWGHLPSGTSGSVALSGPQDLQGRARVQDSWL